MSKATLELKNVSKLYRVGKKEVHALNPISFDLLGDPARIITVAGESGSGKTTLASIMLGLLDPTTGQVLYEGKDVSKLSGSQYRDFRKNVQAVFQDPFASLNPRIKVGDIIAQGPLIQGMSKVEAESLSKAVSYTHLTLPTSDLV